MNQHITIPMLNANGLTPDFLNAIRRGLDAPHDADVVISRDNAGNQTLTVSWRSKRTP
jgi:hypothetical protein